MIHQCERFVIGSCLVFLFVVVQGLSPISPVGKSSSQSVTLPIQSSHVSSSSSSSSWQVFQDLTFTISGKKVGSGNYRKAWTTWSTLAIDHIRHDVQQNLPYAVDLNATLALKFELGVAADVGEMPSFTHCGSRSGYALDFMACRVRRLSDMLVLCHDKNKHETGDNTPSFVAQAVDGFLLQQDTCYLTSIGGGPGFDYTALCLAAAFKGNNGGGGGVQSCSASTRIHGTVFDYEPRWEDLVESLHDSTNRVLSTVMRTTSRCSSTDAVEQQFDPRLEYLHSCRFGGQCDITKSLDEIVNHACREAVTRTNMFVCQYCVAENANPLRQSNFVFFRNLLERASEGSLFIFTETTHRLWPEFVNILLNIDPGGFEVEFIRNRSLQLLIRKRQGASISVAVVYRCAEMKHDAKMHEMKLQNGHARQIKKDRGGKLSGVKGNRSNLELTKRYMSKLSC